MRVMVKPIAAGALGSSPKVCKKNKKTGGIGN